MDFHKPIICAALMCLASGSAAWGQCTGIFPANTLCGNLSGSPQPPAAFSASTSIVGPGSSTVNDLVLFANTTGNQLKDGNGQVIGGSYTWGTGTSTYPESEVPILSNTLNGSGGTPVTSINPTVGISRNEALNNINTTGGQSAGLYISVASNNTTTTNNAQSNGLTVKAVQNGTGDVAAGYFVATENGGPTGGNGHQAVAMFLDTNAVGTHSSAFAIQTNVVNGTGADQTLNSGFSTGFNSALDAVASGANKSAMAIDIRKDNGFAGATFDAGIQFQGGSVATTIFDIRTSSTNILQVAPSLSYTLGIDLLSGAFSTAAFRSPGYAVDGSGNISGGTLVLSSGTPVTTASHISFGTSTTASSSCGTLSGAAGCLTINIGGTNHFVPYY